MHDFQEQCQVHGQRSKNMACRFASTQKEIEKLLEDKDSENTKRSTKVAKELFYEYLKEKNIQEPHDKKELAQVLKSFYVEARLITLTSTLIIPDITKTSSNNCLLFHVSSID